MISGPRIWNIRPIRDLLWIAFWGLVLYCLYVFSAIFMPVFIALLLAYLCQPIIHRAEARFGISKGLAALGIIVIFSISFAGVIALFWPLLQEQAGTLGQKIPEYLQTIFQRWGIKIDTNSLQIQELIKGLGNPKEIMTEIFNRTGQAFNYISQFLNVTGQIMLNMILIPLYFYYFAKNFDEGLAYASSLVPIRYKESVERVMPKIDEAVAGFFRGRVVVSSIVVFLYAFGWYLAGVPYWFLIGLLAGILNIIPYASGVFWPVAVLLKYVDSVTLHPEQSSFMAIVFWPSFVFGVVQFLEGWVLTPWIQGKEMDMSVPTVLIVVFVGGATGGILGLLLCIPVYACAKIIVQELIMPRVIAWTLDRS